MRQTLDDRHLDTFARVADTLLPGVAGDLELHKRLTTEVFDVLPYDSARRDLRRALGLLSGRLGGLLLHGRFRKFPRMDRAGREQALRRMASSRIGQARLVFRALKSIVGFLYGNRPQGSTGAYPPWVTMGYPGPDGPPPDVPKPIAPIRVAIPQAWETDVVVIGSGAGGGVAAGVLAASGLDVVVLERGGYRNESDFTHVEAEALADLYLDGGMSATKDGSIGLISGSTLGGGTVVNYSTSFATPPSVRQEWDTVSGLHGVFTGSDFEASARAVHARSGVNSENSFPSQRELVMERGLRHLGWHVEAMPRNAVSCTAEACGYCGLGCRIGSKQSTLRTWLEDAVSDGARVVVDCHVNRVLVSGDRAVGVQATVSGNSLTVRARAVVVAAGALNTPVILMRSGIRRSPIGANLRLHPVTVVWGRFDDAIEPWSGVMQALYSDQFADLDGHGYGFRFETAPVHPMFPATLLGFGDGASFRDDLDGLRNWSPLGVLLRDRDGGRVGTRRDGSPLWNYRLSGRDTAHMREGVFRAAEVLAAAGATEVVSSTLSPVRWRPDLDRDVTSFATSVDACGFGPNQMVYLSFHQMGSTRMGADPSTSAIDGDNKVHGVAGLYVMDGSAFPTASGVNPMMSIQTVAHRAAAALAATL